MEVTISVEDGRLADIGAVAAAAQRAGLRDVTVLATAGAITGTVADDAVLREVAAVDGVAAAEPAREIRLPPRDGPQ